MAARYYDPRFGRFTSTDPEQTTMSPYSYCLNNPVSLIDPTGHRAACAGGGYSINYARKDYDFLMYIRNHPWPQTPPTAYAFDVNDPITWLFAHLTGMEDIIMRRQLHWDLIQQAVLEKMVFEARKREEERRNEEAEALKKLWNDKISSVVTKEMLAADPLLEKLDLPIFLKLWFSMKNAITPEFISKTGSIPVGPFGLFTREISLGELFTRMLESYDIVYLASSTDWDQLGSFCYANPENSTSVVIALFEMNMLFQTGAWQNYAWEGLVHESMHLSYPRTFLGGNIETSGWFVSPSGYTEQFMKYNPFH